MVQGDTEFPFTVCFAWWRHFKPNVARFSEVLVRFQDLGLCLEAALHFSVTAVPGLQGFPCSPWKNGTV